MNYVQTRQALAKVEQEIIYWRGLLELVMSEHFAEGISEATENKVLQALGRNDGTERT